MIENFKELYKRTDNPLLRDQTLGTLLQLKEKSVTYTDIEIQHSKNKKYKANKEDYNGRGELYTILFETWRYYTTSLFFFKVLFHNGISILPNSSFVRILT